MKFCVIIPVYNSPYIREVVLDVLNYDYKIIVVDDGSDEKLELEDLDIELVTHKTNEGKGGAILSGASRAKELGYDAFVTMDADKQHISSQIIKLVNTYKDETIIIGNRDFSGANVPNSSKFGREFSNFWVRLETFKKLGDTQSGFRMYPISILELPLKNKRFDFEIEVLAYHSYAGKEIRDVEVACYYPPSDERVSHFNKVNDNIRLTMLHTKLMIQRYAFLRGWLWK